MTIAELREQRAKCVHDARKLIDKADAEKRSLTSEEDAKVKSLLAEADKHRQSIEQRELLETQERQLAQTQGRRSDPPQPGGAAGPVNRLATPEYRSLFERAFRDGRESLAPDERRALQADSDTAGGYLVAPQQMTDSLLQAVDNVAVVRQLATKFSVPMAASLGVPSLDADPSDPDWTTELQTGSEDSAMTFGKRSLTPRPLAKRLKVSETLLRIASVSVEQIVRERLGYKFGVAQENAFMTGSGAGQPLGVFTASSQGISTGRDIATGNTATGITFDGLKSAKGVLKDPYLRDDSRRWIFHRDAVTQIEKLKDGNGQYIWQYSSQMGQPDMLLGIPVIRSEYAPNTFTTGLYVGLLGALRYYYIADSLALVIKRLNELYAESDQVGFIGRLECDGMPALEEAFVRVKLA